MFKFINITKLEIAQELIKELIYNSSSYHPNFQATTESATNQKTGWDFTNLSQAFANPDVIVVPNTLARLQISKIINAGHAISAKTNVQFPKYFRSGVIKTLFNYINQNKIQVTYIARQYASRFALSDKSLQGVVATGEFDNLDTETQQKLLLQAFQTHLKHNSLELNETFQGISTWTQILAFQDIIDSGNNKFLSDIYKYEQELPLLCSSLSQAYHELATHPATSLQFGYLFTPQSTGFTEEELGQGAASQASLIKGGIDNFVLEPSYITQVVNHLNMIDQSGYLNLDGEIRDNPISEPEDFDDGYTESLLQEYGYATHLPIHSQQVAPESISSDSSLLPIFKQWAKEPSDFSYSQAQQRNENLLFASLEQQPSPKDALAEPIFTTKQEISSYQELQHIPYLPNTNFRDPRILNTTYSRVKQISSIVLYYANYFPKFYIELNNSSLDFRKHDYAQLNQASKTFIHKFFGERPELYQHDFLGKLDILHRVILNYKLYSIVNLHKESEFLAPRRELIQRLRNLPATFSQPTLKETLYKIFNDERHTFKSQQKQAKHEILRELGLSFEDKPEPRDDSSYLAKLSSIFLYAEALDFMQNCKFKVLDSSILSSHNVFILGDKYDTKENINFYATISELLGYNIYYFNQVPTFGMWQTQAALGREELLNYRINQIYCDLVASSQQSDVPNNTANKPQNIANIAQHLRIHRKSEVNNNPLTYWGQVARKTYEIAQEFANQSCDIMHIYYDAQEMQERHQENLKYLETQLLSYTEKTQAHIPNSQLGNQEDWPQITDLQNQTQLDFYTNLSKLAPIPSLLTQLQKSIYEYWDFKPEQPLYYLAANDNSIQIYAALNKKREIEYVQQQILQALSQDPQLELDDILVVSPVMEQYAPIISQVFDKYRQDQALHHSAKPLSTAVPLGTVGEKYAYNSTLNLQRYLPYQILDCNCEIDELLNWCKKVLTLRTDYIQVYDLECLLAYSWMQEFYGLTTTDLTHLLNYINNEHKTNEYFGEISFVRSTPIKPIDFSSGQEQDSTVYTNFKLDTGIDYNSWQQIILQLGLSSNFDYQGHSHLLSTTTHSKTTTITSHELVAKFQTLFLDLQDLAQIVGTEQELTTWFELLERLRCKYFKNHETQSASLDQFIRMHSLLIASANSLRLRVSNLVFLDQIEQELQSQHRTIEKPGRITFAKMDAVNATNYKFVIAMGMGADNFPSHRKYFEVDLSNLFIEQAQHPSQYELDVHSFLQLLLNTGKRLLFTYEGYNSKQEPLNICQPLDTLRAFLDNYCGAPTLYIANIPFLDNDSPDFGTISLTPIQEQLNLLLAGKTSSKDTQNLFSRHNYLTGTLQPSSTRNFCLTSNQNNLSAQALNNSLVTLNEPEHPAPKNSKELVQQSLQQLLQTPPAQLQQQSLLDLLEQTPAQQDLLQTSNTSNQAHQYLNDQHLVKQLSYLLPWLGQKSVGISEWLTPYLQQYQINSTPYFSDRYFNDAKWLLSQVYGSATSNSDSEYIAPQIAPLVKHIEKLDDNNPTNISCSLEEIINYFTDTSVYYTKRYNLNLYKEKYFSEQSPVISSNDESKNQCTKKWNNLILGTIEPSKIYDGYLNGKQIISEYSLNSANNPSELIDWVTQYHQGKITIKNATREATSGKNSLKRNLNFSQDSSEARHSNYKTSIDFEIAAARIKEIFQDYRSATNNAFIQAKLGDNPTKLSSFLELNEELNQQPLPTQAQMHEFYKNRLHNTSEWSLQQIHEFFNPSLELSSLKIFQNLSDHSPESTNLKIRLAVEFEIYLPKGRGSEPNSTDNKPALYFRYATAANDKTLDYHEFAIFKILAFMHTQMYQQFYDNTLPNLIIENCRYDEQQIAQTVVARYLIPGDEINYLSLDLTKNKTLYESNTLDISDDKFLSNFYKSPYSLIGNQHKVEPNLKFDLYKAKLLFVRCLSFYLCGKDLLLPLGKYNFLNKLAANRNFKFPADLQEITQMYLSCFNSYQIRLNTVEPNKIS